MKIPDSIYKQAADELNLPVALVKRINNYYWKDVKARLSGVEHSSIFLKNIGTIVISKYKLNKMILSLIERIRRVEYSNKYTEKRKGLIIDAYKVNLRKLLKMRNEIIKNDYFKHGYNY